MAHDSAMNILVAITSKCWPYVLLFEEVEKVRRPNMAPRTAFGAFGPSYLDKLRFMSSWGTNPHFCLHFVYRHKRYCAVVCDLNLCVL